jgi:hypothetical protein
MTSPENAPQTPKTDSQISAAWIGFWGMVIAAIIGVIAARGCGGCGRDDSDPRVEIIPPVTGKVIDSDLSVSVEFAVQNLGASEIWVDLATDAKFSDSSLLRSIRLTAWDRNKPSATITARDQPSIQSGFVRVRLVGAGGAPAASDKAPFHVRK